MPREWAWTLLQVGELRGHWISTKAWLTEPDVLEDVREEDGLTEADIKHWLDAMVPSLKRLRQDGEIEYGIWQRHYVPMPG